MFEEVVNAINVSAKVVVLFGKALDTQVDLNRVEVPIDKFNNIIYLVNSNMFIIGED